MLIILNTFIVKKLIVYVIIGIYVNIYVLIYGIYFFFQICRPQIAEMCFDISKCIEIFVYRYNEDNFYTDIEVKHFSPLCTTQAINQIGLIAFIKVFHRNLIFNYLSLTKHPRDLFTGSVDNGSRSE